MEKHGYSALQLGFEEQNTRSMTRPQAGYFKKAGIEKVSAVVREIRLDDGKDVAKHEVERFSPPPSASRPAMWSMFVA